MSLGIDYHRDQTGKAKRQASDQGPHTSLRRRPLPADSKEEHSRDGRGDKALDALDVVIQALSHFLDHQNPEHSEHDHNHSGQTSDAYQFLLRGVRVAALVDVDRVEHRRRVIKRSQRTHQCRKDTTDHHTFKTNGEQGVDQHREGQIRIGESAVSLKTKRRGEHLPSL